MALVPPLDPLVSTGSSPPPVRDTRRATGVLSLLTPTPVYALQRCAKACPDQGLQGPAIRELTPTLLPRAEPHASLP